MVVDVALVSFKVTQLTGFSDPVYAEAYVHVNQYDIVLDVLIVNQTNDTLQNLTLELATLGSLNMEPSFFVVALHHFGSHVLSSQLMFSVLSSVLFKHVFVGLKSVDLSLLSATFFVEIGCR